MPNPRRPHRSATVSFATLLAYAAFHGLGCAQMFIGETIGVNFQGTAPPPGTGISGVLGIDAAAGVLLQKDWNNINFTPPAAAGTGTGNVLVTTSNLLYDNGVDGSSGTSAVSLSVQAASSNKSGVIGTSTNNKILLNGIIKANATNPTPTFSFGGLAAGYYQVIVYTTMNASGGRYSATLDETTYYQTAQNGAAFTGTFVRGTNTNATAATLPTVNYVQFDSASVTAGTMNLGFNWLGGSDGAGVAGIQLKLLQFIDVWSGSTNGTWDVNTTFNWNGNGAATKYFNGNVVSFGDVDGTLPTPVPVTNRSITIAAGGVTPGNILVNNSDGDYSFGGGAIGGAASVTKSGTSMVTFNQTNTYTGGTVVKGGTVQLGAVNALGSDGSVSLRPGTTLDLNGNSQTVGVLTASGTVTDNSGASGTLVVASGTVKTDFGDATLGGNISDGAGTVALVKNTAGTLALKSPSTFSGGTTVSAGTLSVGDNAALGTGGVTLAGGTILSFDTGNAGLYEGVVPGGQNTGAANPKTHLSATTRLANVTTGQQTFPTGLPDNNTVIYTGYLNNPGAATSWTFAENFDDFVSLTINGVTVLNNNAAVTPSLGTVAINPGLNSFELRLGQLTGPVGPANTPWFTGTLGVGVDTQGRNQQVAANYTALPVDSGNGNTFIAGIADSIANVVTLTGNATINVGYSVGGSGSARVGGVVTGANTLNLTGVPANSAISSSATTVSTGANFNVDGNVTFNPGALNDNGVAVAMTKSGPGLMRIGTTATSVVAGTSLNVTAGAVAFGGTGDSLTGSVPFGSGSVTLQSGATLRLDGQTDGPGLLGQYYSVTPANVANSNPNFATLTTLNAHLATLTPTVTASTTLNGKLDFDFSNINYGDGAPFNGGDPTRGDYGFTNTDNMEVRWTGYINITNPGLATFSTTSDDGTVIFINDGDTPVVNNNFYQGATTRTGTYNFTTPGYHKITMGFYEGTGGSGALFQWNQAGDSLHTLLNSEVVKPFGAQQTYTNNVNIAANSTIAVSNSLKAGVGAVSIGTATLSVTSPDPTTSAYSLTASGTTLTGNPTFNVADSTGGGKGTFNTGALNDGGVARTITKTNTGTLRVDSAGTSLVAGTIFDVQQGTLSTASSLVNPLGNSAVQLSGGRLSLDGTPGIATGLLTQLYDTTPASQAVYNNLNTLNAYLDGLTPVVMTGSTTGGKLDFNYSNDNYGGGAPFNGPNDATHAAYGFAPANNMQVRWTGFINVGTIGLANFWSTSDDGSMIFVNGQVVVNNNGSHGAIEQTGTFDFTTTGWHEITLAFFEGDGGAGALFEWNEFGGTRHTMLSSETQHQGFAQIQSYANNVLVTQDSEISVSNSLTAAIGTLSVGGQTLTVSNPNGLAYTLTAASTTLTGSPTLHVTSGSFAPGAITGGANAITKTGSGTLLLDKTNTYSGTTTISEGVLQVGDGGTDGTLGSGEIINDAVLTFNRSDTVTVTNDITGSGTVNNNGTATNILNLDGVQGYLTLNANGGTTNVNESFTGGTATVNVNANAALNFTANQTLAALNIGDGATVVLDSAAPAFGSVEPSSQAAIPEPGSAGLLLVGVLGLFARRRRD